MDVNKKEAQKESGSTTGPRHPERSTIFQHAKIALAGMPVRPPRGLWGASSFIDLTLRCQERGQNLFSGLGLTDDPSRLATVRFFKESPL